MNRLTMAASLTALMFTALTASACDGFTPRDPDISQNNEGNLEIIVSNQSFEIDAVDVEVFIDGELAISDVFHVESQHNFVSHTFKVPPGTHSLTAVTDAGEADLSATVTTESDKRWAVLMYWYYPDTTGGAGPTPRQFSYDEMDQQPLFD